MIEPRFLKAAAAAPKADPGRGRVGLAIFGFAAVFLVISARLVVLGVTPDRPSAAWRTAQDSVAAARPDILDRNGEILATDLRSVSLFAEPRKVIDADEAVELLSSILPELGNEATRHKLASNAGFVWLKRELSPSVQRQIHDLGLPGIGFLVEKKRFYPGGNVAGHILGAVNVDNQGISGVEKTIDGQGLSDLHALGFAQTRNLEPVKLSIDLRVQHVVRDEILRAVDRYQALFGVGIVLDVETGEVVAMTSVPDYDPNDPVQALDKDRMNRATAGVFELGSVFKMFTLAAALDSGVAAMSSTVDASRPLHLGRFTIKDFHGKGRVLNFPEIFIYSSNIGTGRLALALGQQRHPSYFARFGFLKRLNTDLPEVGAPIVPNQWKDVTLVTTAFGHGISVSPLSAVSASAALVNGGKLIPPTFFPRSKEAADKLATQVVSPQTSDSMRVLFRMNAVPQWRGSGRNAEVPGYRVGGKTGTAEKVVNGRYSSDKNRNSFLAAFPMEKPRYIVFVMLDEPKPDRFKGGGRTAGSNAAPTVANIIRRTAAMLGVEPRFDDPTAPLLVSY
jgi:cell division protein FtsI (penicillin-binding protein 3)